MPITMSRRRRISRAWISMSVACAPWMPPLGWWSTIVQWQRVTLTLSAAGENQRGGAGRHPGAERADRRMDVAHRVVDGQSRRQRAARAVDVDADLLVGILAVEEEQLRDNQIGDIVIDLGAKEDDAIAKQPGIDVIRSLAAGG